MNLFPTRLENYTIRTKVKNPVSPKNYRCSLEILT